MKRYVVYVTVFLLTFIFSVCVFHFRDGNRFGGARSGPLRVIISPPNSVPSDQYQTITIKNVSDRVVRGYSLGFKCNCRSWDSDDRLYPYGISYTNPIPEHQLLQPGESKEFMWQLSETNTAGNQQLEVWVDLVHFQGGGNWGPNHSHKEGYVRE